MARRNLRLFWAFLLILVAFSPSSEAVRNFGKRSDLAGVPPLSESGYTVPLQGGMTCTSPVTCTDSLPAPGPAKSLQRLAIARGVLTYDCTNLDQGNAPKFVSQNTDLYDAAPLIPFLPNQDALHQLVPQFYDYDYAQLQNSTLMCIGTICTEGAAIVVNLDRLETYDIRVVSSIEPPYNAGVNAYWAYSTSLDGAWDVYRVETAGGAVPPVCDGHDSTFQVGYAAEYWFYHT